LADHLYTLLGDSFTEETSATSLDQLDEDASINMLESHLPEIIDADVFINEIAGLGSTYRDTASGTGINARPVSGEAVAVPQA